MSRQKFGIQFSIAARLWRRHLDQRLAQAGIKDISWAPLLHLDEFGDGISQKDLAASVGMEGSTLVRLLDTLEQKGQIERQADSHDRRAKRIYLTDAGRDQVGALRAELLQIETEMLADVSDEQIDVMLEVLDGLITKFKH
ncbi:MarR family winged helix-turn-helix transcriptional regulator [Vibrio fluvialis]|uniref:MarR family winged helix-turn-helix transcriptional regulator n=1 Tax=Vibrio fluvialis TaxID=676 RepID=UPI00050967D1|nr:MarR family transcriptional regulator [Vibrio fluvialis]EKO3488284.1 MarR family transcriptional regulator [Vibrio fluvialis]MBL4240052.1 MarR family transcriptional regulator [Vibrio fluvialis]MBL4266531.1 MarR family transcriptional regulator [Vibrio fluvialis]MBL4271003.1 MarR family transcriptional regulator [Vibrio fluvialis]MBL4275399.1 MarR family transcriptional regulator [Vibrio fluvialis]